MNNIVLIRPPMVLSQYSLSTSATPPLAIAYLSGFLRDNGFDPQTIDALGEGLDSFTPIEATVGIAQGLPIDEIVNRIADDAKIIGYSAMFSSSWTYDKKILQSIRDRFPGAIIIAGGEHISACADYVLTDCSAINICARGEGEETLLDIAEKIYQKKEWSQVDGISYINNGEVITNPSRSRIRSIDQIPEPYWDNLPIEKYLSGGYSHGVDIGRSMPLLATRGCPYRCTFCSSPSMWTTRWEARSPQLVFDEMVKYIEKYKVDNFDLYDLTAIVKKSWIVEFCDIIIESGKKFTWQLPSGTRSEAIDEEVVGKLWVSGCRNMNYAPESGSVEVLSRIKKKVSLPKLIDSMRFSTKRGLSVKMNMIFAFPQDTPYELWQNFKFGIKCAWLGIEDSTFIPFVPYPGSELYSDLVSQNKIEPPSDNYFNSLIPFSDLQFAKSYNKHFKDWQLVWIRCLYFAVFYGVKFLRWPKRPILITKNLLSGKQESRGEEIIKNIINRKKQTIKI